MLLLLVHGSRQKRRSHSVVSSFSLDGALVRLALEAAWDHFPIDTQQRIEKGSQNALNRTPHSSQFGEQTATHFSMFLF